jgi:hypothetical protein
MLIAGNLDVEVTWARMDAAARRARGEKAPSPDDPRFALPEPVMRKISAAATLLRVFATSDDDVLWTPRPVDPSRMALTTFWMPKLRLVSGPLPRTADLWWGDASDVAARANHRAFAWQAKVRFGESRLPGGTMVWDVEGLERAVADLMRDHDSAAWVAKAPYSAAGRLRVRGAGEPDDKQRFQAERLLELQGMLLFEPWMSRVADFGSGGRVLDSHATVGGLHGLDVDPHGRFAGIADDAPAIDAQAAVSVGAATGHMGEALRAAGYRGPYTVDGFTYADDGETRVQCVSEINARQTFGDVAAQVIDMARETIEGLADAEIVRLRFGRGAPPSGTIPLLLPGTDDDASAWLEVGPRHAG